jgi:hypothetical protein
MIHLKKSSCLVAILILANLSLFAQKDENRVLFVGNSYTYFWNLPQLVSAMGKEIGANIYTEQSTAGGVNWKQHWNAEKGLKTRELIEEGSWDAVVLQNHSLSTVRNKEEFLEYGRKLISLVKEVGAKPILYITWAREGNPLMQEGINETYLALAKETQIEVVHIGTAWQEAKKIKPEINLYDQDGSHPNINGTYLTAALFLKKLTGESISEVPERLTSTDAMGQKIYLAILEEYEAQFYIHFAENFNDNQE